MLFLIFFFNFFYNFFFISKNKNFLQYFFIPCMIKIFCNIFLLLV